MEPQEKAHIRVALYARVSTEEQSEGQSIDSQVAELERFAAQNGWTVHGRYIDEGWSGALLSRPELDRLRDDAAQGLFDVVLVNDVDRMARDVMHLGVIKRDLEKKQIRVIFRKLPGASDPMNNLMVNILGSFAEFERELIIDRTRRGKRHKVEVRKEYIGCIAPYGYRYIKKSLSGGVGILQLNVEEAEVVKQMFQWAAEEGLSINKVAERLTRLRIPTRRQRHIWKVPTVYKILRNEAYAGVWAFGKVEACEPLQRRKPGLYRKKKSSRRRRPQSEWLKIALPQELIIINQSRWLAVQQQLDKNRRLSPRNRKFKYLLQGLLRCDFCSSVVTGRYCRDAKNIWVYYICRNCKNLRWIPRDDLETAVWSAAKRALLDPKYLESRTQIALDRISNATESIHKRQIDLSLKEIELKEAGLLKAYQAGSLSGVQLAAHLDDLKRTKSSLLQSAPEKSIDVQQVRARIGEYCNIVRHRLANASFETKQKILRHLVSRVLVSNESLRIEGELTMPEVADTSSAIAYLTPTERRSNCGAIKFELYADLPRWKRRLKWKDRADTPKNSSSANALK